MPPINPKPRFVYFDLDDTILDHRKAEKRALADLKLKYATCFAEIDQEIIEETYHAGNVILWHQYALNQITKDQLRRQRFEHLLQKLSIKSLDPIVVGSYYMERYANYWDYCAGAREAFFEIADRYPVGILTNGFAGVQHAKLAQFPEMRDRLDVCVVSEEFGHMKPHPKLFKHASDLAKVNPDEILYVGDSLTSDVEGGKNAGWNVIWYAPSKKKATQDIIQAKNWSEVTDMLI